MLAFPKYSVGEEGRDLVELPVLLDIGALTWGRLQILVSSPNLAIVLSVLLQTGQIPRDNAPRATGELGALLIYRQND